MKFFLDGGYDFSSMGVGAILWNGCGMQGQYYVGLFQGTEMEEGFHYRNWILYI